MNDTERDEKIIEMASDIKWLKSWSVEHRSTHAKYHIMLWAVAIGLIIQYLR